MTKKIHRMTKIALMAALLCIVGPFAVTFPFSPVPISLATLMLYVSVSIVGKKDACISCGIYLLIGLVGLPVFSGFSGGIGKLLGPTGGYLLGYLLLVWISGLWMERAKAAAFFAEGIGMAFGTAVCYLFGSIWLAYQSHMTLRAAMLVGVLPFLPGDFLKILIGIVLGREVKKRLYKAGI